jgi:hypothetical protein
MIVMGDSGGDGRRRVSQRATATAVARLHGVTMVAAQLTAGRQCDHDGNSHERRRRQ